MKSLRLFGITLLVFAGVAATPAWAIFNCDLGKGAKCHCAGADDCKSLEKSGMCANGASLNCESNKISSVGYTCDCTAKLKGVDTNATKVPPATNKSQ
jgi:hypothetical protein